MIPVQEGELKTGQALNLAFMASDPASALPGVIHVTK